MKEYTLPKATMLIWQLRAAMLWVVAVAVCGYYSFKIGHILAAILILVVLFGIIIFWYIPERYKSYRIKRSSDAVVIETGVIFKSTHILPNQRLIYTQKIVSPLAKRFNLTALTLKAARSIIFIPEMSSTEAEQFLEEIGV